MRVFVIAFAYHSDRSIGSSSFSFNSVDTRRLEAGSKHLNEILDSTVRLLSSVAEILRTNLHCDDFRMLPETSSLWPVFQCMVRFPELASNCRDWIAATTLRLMLADLTSGQLLNLVAQVNEAADVAEAMAVFDGKPQRANSVGATIRRGVDRAQSLTDKYALMLYWLIRKHGAKDFSYGLNLSKEKAEELRVKYREGQEAGEPEVSACVEPQKQHVLAFPHCGGRLRLIATLHDPPSSGSSSRPWEQPVRAEPRSRPTRTAGTAEGGRAQDFPGPS